MTSPGGAVELATAYVSLSASAQGMGSQIVGQLTGAGDQAGQQAGAAASSSFGAALGKGMAVAGAAGIAAAGAMGKALYSVGGVFDDVADTIRVGTGATGDTLDGLVDVAKAVGSKVPSSFEQIGPAVADLNTRLGLSGKTLETVASQYLQAGNILGQDVDINKTSAAFSAFGVAGDDVVGAMDSLFRVSQDTGVGMNELASSITAQAPALKNLGFGFEQTANLAGQLDKAGVNSTAAMASLSKGLVTLAQSGKDPQEAFKDITQQVADLTAAGKSAEAINLAAGIFGTRGATQFVGAVQSGKLSVESLTGAVASNGDTILAVADDTADAAESWQLFKNKALTALEPVGTGVFNLAGKGLDALNKGFDKLAPVITKFGKKAGSAFGKIGDVVGPAFVKIWETLGPALKDVIPLVSQVATVFSPVKLIFQVLKPLLPELGRAFSSIGQALAGGVASALRAVAPLLQVIGGAIEKLIPFVSKLIAQLLPPLVSLFDKIAPLLDAIFSALTPVIDALVSFLIPAIEALMPVVEDVFGFFARSIGNFVKLIEGVIDIITGIFSGDWSKAWDGVKKIFGAVWDQIKNIAGTVIKWFTTLIPKIWDAISSAGSWLLEQAKKIPGWIWDGIKSAAGAVWGWFTGVAGWIWDKIKQGASNLTSWAKGILSWIWDGIKLAAGAVWDWFLNVPRWIWDKIKQGASALTQWAKGILGWIWDGIKLAAGAVWDWFTSLPGWAWDKIKQGASALVSAGKWIVNKIKEGIRSLWNTLFDDSAITDMIDQSMSTARAKITADLKRQGISTFGGSSGFYADGGYLQRGQTAFVGEAGMEMITWDGARPLVHSNPDTMRMLATAKPASSGRGGPLIDKVIQQPGQSAWSLASDINRLAAVQGGMGRAV